MAPSAPPIVGSPPVGIVICNASSVNFTEQIIQQLKFNMAIAVMSFQILRTQSPLRMLIRPTRQLARSVLRPQWLTAWTSVSG